MKKRRRKGSVLTGFIGAFLGAMLGAAVWAAIYIFGYMASIVGVLIGFLAGKGYDLMHGRRGAARVIVVALCVILAVAAGNVAAYAWMLHDTYQTEVAALSPLEQQFVLSEAEYFEEVVPELMEDDEFLGEAAKDLGIGLVFAFLGAVGSLRKEPAKRKKKARPEETKTE